MSNDEIRKHLPPYVSYRTFRNFVDRLQQRMPSRIDRSYWGDILSGSTGTQLMAAMRFLGLVDNIGKPTERLKLLAAARGEQRAQHLRELAAGAFGFVMKSSLDLESATYSQLEEAFHNTFQLTNDVSRKCVKFFIALAGEAGIPMSPFIIRRTRSASAISSVKSTVRKASPGTNRNVKVPQEKDKIPDGFSWNSMLLAKFPNFDPSWNDEIKLKWFKAFDELLTRGNPGS